VPEHCVASSDGRISTDPSDLFAGGSLLPLGGARETGGHKGYCLSSLVDLLCGVLTGASWGPFIPPFPADLDEPARSVGQGVGHMFGALWTGAFSDPETFRVRMDDWIQTMRCTPGVEGRGPLIPGDPERIAAAHSRTLGVAIACSVLDDLEALGRELGVNFE